MKTERIDVKAGMTVVFDLIAWNAGWEFERPICMIRPVKREGDDGEAFSMVEGACIDACLDGYIQSDSGLKDRPWSGPLWTTLERNHAESLRGKTFKKYEYFGYRYTVKFFTNKDNELDFEIRSVQEGNHIQPYFCGIEVEEPYGVEGEG